jgi:hypothetical protein
MPAMRPFLLTCLLLVPAALVGPAPPAAAQTQSHLLQAPLDHVVLRAAATDLRDDNPCPGDFRGKAFFRILPDGTRETLPFAVPSGRLLVVTDVEWTASRLVGGGALLAGRPVVLSLSLKAPPPSTPEVVFRSEGVRSGYGQGRVVAGSDQLTAGFAVAEQTGICAGVAQLVPNGFSGVRTGPILLRGYLVDGP